MDMLIYISLVYIGTHGIYMCIQKHMGWLRLVGSFKYRFFCKRVNIHITSIYRYIFEMYVYTKDIMVMLGSFNCDPCLNNTILSINEYMYDISACICSYIYH